MLPSKHQKGMIHLGILGVLFLLGGLLVGAKLVSNSDLTFFNIAEKAATQTIICNQQSCPAGHKKVPVGDEFCICVAPTPAPVYAPTPPKVTPQPPSRITGPKKLGQSCGPSDGDCASGLSCKNRVCQIRKSPNGKLCIRDADCESNNCSWNYYGPIPGTNMLRYWFTCSN